MKFTISREALLRPLTLVAGVVERRQTLPVLSNVLIQVEGDQVALTEAARSPAKLTKRALLRCRLES